MTKRIEEVEFEVATNDKFFFCRALVYLYEDSQYGQDADGNRSEPRVFVDDKEIYDVREIMEDGEMIPWEFEYLPKEIQERLLDRIPTEALV